MTVYCVLKGCKHEGATLRAIFTNYELAMQFALQLVEADTRYINEVLFSAFCCGTCSCYRVKHNGHQGICTSSGCECARWIYSEEFAIEREQCRWIQSSVCSWKNRHEVIQVQERKIHSFIPTVEEFSHNQTI